MVLKFRFLTKWDSPPTDSLAGLARRRFSRGGKTGPQGEWFWGSRFFESHISCFILIQKDWLERNHPISDVRVKLK